MREEKGPNMSHQEPIRSERQPQPTGDLEARTPDPEVVPKAKRRKQNWGGMPHNIIDNRSNKLLDTIFTTLPGTDRARFGVR